MSTQYAAARRLLELGCSVFPCRSDQKRPATPRGLYDSTTDPRQVNKWWRDEDTLNPAINCGASDLVVLDFDEVKEWPADSERPTGVETGADVLAWHGERGDHDMRWLFTAPQVKTARGGDHYYFRPLPDRPVKNRVSYVPGCDVRTQGGYVLAPSSIFEGKPYTVGTGWRPFNPPPLPQWIADLVDPPRSRFEAVYRALNKPPAPQGAGYAETALRNEVENVQHTTEGTRNDQLNRSSFNIGQLVATGHLASADAADALLSAATSTGLPEWEARGTITSGFNSGAQHPRRATR